MRRLDPTNPYLFQQPKKVVTSEQAKQAKKAKKSRFHPGDEDPNHESVYFNNSKMGINTIAKFMPMVRYFFLFL